VSGSVQNRTIHRIVDWVTVAIIAIAYADFLWISRVMWLVPIGTRMGMFHVGVECDLVALYAVFGSIALSQWARRRWPVSVGFSRMRERALIAALGLPMLSFCYFPFVINFRHLHIVPGG
jgi:hypothetical protein